MAAWLEGHEKRCPARRGTRGGKGMDFGMWSTVFLVPPLGYPVSMVVNNHRPHGRIRLHFARPALRQLKRPPHQVFCKWSWDRHRLLTWHPQFAGRRSGVLCTGAPDSTE